MHNAQKGIFTRFSISLVAVATLALFGIIGWSAPTHAYTVTDYNIGMRNAFVTYDGTNLWFASSDDDVVKRVNPANGQVTSTYPVAEYFTPSGIHWDGQYVWVKNKVDTSEYQLMRIDGSSNIYLPGPLGGFFPIAENYPDPFARYQSDRFFARNGTNTYHDSIYRVDASGNILVEDSLYSGGNSEYRHDGLHVIDGSTVLDFYTRFIPGTTTSPVDFGFVKRNRTTLDEVGSRCVFHSPSSMQLRAGVSIWDGTYAWFFVNDTNLGKFVKKFDPNNCTPVFSTTGVGSYGYIDATYDGGQNIYAMKEANRIIIERWDKDTNTYSEIVNRDCSVCRPLKIQKVGDSLWVTYQDEDGGKVTKFDFSEDASLTITSGPNASPVNSRDATVTWATNLNADSRVDFGTTTAYGSYRTDFTDTTSHSIFINGLQPNTVYHYKVTSCNDYICVSSSDRQFTTTALQAPVVTITDPTDGQEIPTSTYTMIGNAHDNDGLITNAAYRVCLNNCTSESYSTIANPNQANYNISKSISFSGYGTFHIQVRARDNDNLESVASIHVHRGATPVVNITSHTNGQLVDTTTIDISGSATDADDAITTPMRVSVNGGAFQNIPITSSQNVSWGPKTITLDLGGNTIRVEATDASGNVGFKQIVVNRGTPPTVDITSHNDGDEVHSSSVALSGTASDSDGTVNQVQVRVNGGAWSNASGTSSWSKSITVSAGSNLVEVRARDNDSLYGYDQVTLIYTIPDYTFELISDSPLTKQRGENAEYTFRLSGINGWSTAVNLTVDQRDGVPVGNFTWSRTSVTPDADGEEVTLTVTTSNLNPSSSPFNMRAKADKQGGGNIKYANFDLILTDGPDFTLSSPDTSETIQPGQQAHYVLNLVESVPSYTFPVALTTDSITKPTGGDPADLTINYAPASTTPTPHGAGTSAVTISTASDIQVGTWVVKVKASGSDPLSRIKYLDLTIIIGDAPDFEITATPLTQIGEFGGTVTYTLNLRETIPEYTWPVAVTLDQVWGNDEGDQSSKITTTSLPQNVTPGDSAGPGTNQNVVINIAADAPADTYTLTFKGAGTDPLNKTHFVTVELVLQDVDFDIYHTQGSTYLQIQKGTYRIWDIKVKSINGFTEPVRTTLEDEWPNDPEAWDHIAAEFVNSGTKEIIVIPPADGEVDASVIIRPGGNTPCGFYHITARGRDDQVVGPPDTAHSVLVKFEVVGCEEEDTEPPVIDPAQISCSPDVDRITVNWTTDEPANGTLFYGTNNPPTGSKAENNGLVTSHSVTATGLNQNTTYYYQVQSCDEAGNCSEKIPVPPGTCQTTEFIDNEAPVVSWVEPSDGQTVSGTIAMKVSATDNIGIQDVRFLVDGALISTDTNPPGCDPYYCYTTWDTTLYSDGNHSLTATARDTAGNPSSRTIVVTVINDTTGPMCSNLSYEVGATWANISWSTSENSDSRVYYCREGYPGEPETCGNCGSDGYCANDQRGPDCYYCQAQIRNESVISHLVTLSDLNPGSPYHFMAESCDDAGNCGQCGG
ncbi:MAG: fibronectin type III domain-containing protein [Candidatus Nomurabacteria bacterium]|nr:MAG: fibronectin type III domain-containing protein [Candidatus Nomurabacteria bacterium]